MSDWPRTNVRTRSGKVKVPVRLGYEGPQIGHLLIDPGRLPQDAEGFDFYLAPGGFKPAGAARFDLTVVALQRTKEVRDWLKVEDATRGA